MGSDARSLQKAVASSCETPSPESWSGCLRAVEKKSRHWRSATMGKCWQGVGERW
jgi:hypothetical protein